MADRDEAESADESTPAAQPDHPADRSPEDEAALAEHVAPDDAREPTLEELEQLLEADDSGSDGVADVDRTDDGTDGTDDGTDEGDGLVAVGAAPAGRSRTGTGNGADSATAARTAEAGKARAKKDKATPKQRRDVEKPKRTTLVSFSKEAVGELRKVVYPTAPQLGNYFVVVLVFVLVIVGFVYLLDLGFGWVIVKVFG